ncbi:MAG: hypothetical protein PHN88_14680 [Ignavibacteria bacterium]|nr:hypothetical protein [Ignavibacteria bacterium]
MEKSIFIAVTFRNNRHNIITIAETVNDAIQNADNVLDHFSGEDWNLENEEYEEDEKYYIVKLTLHNIKSKMLGSLYARYFIDFN